MTLSKEYIAGLVDGEGWIGIAKHRTTTGYRLGFAFRPACKVSLTGEKAEPLLKQIKEQYSGARVSSRQRGSNKTLYTFKIAGRKNLKLFLGDVLPFLQIKKIQAEAILEYFEITSRQSYLTDKELNSRVDIYNRLKVLNLRGWGPPNLLKLELRPRKNPVAQWWQPKFSKRELEDLYWDQGLSTVEIAELKRCSVGLVRSYMRQYQIPRHTKSEIAKGRRRVRGKFSNPPMAKKLLEALNEQL